MRPLPRVLALGLAEASWSRIREASLAAHLPCLTRLISSAACGVTVAPQPLVSEAMWATLVTGRTADAHRVFGSTTEVVVPPIWRLLEESGVPTGTFNLRIRHRPESASGFLVSSDGTERVARRLVHPPALYRDLRKRFGVWSTSTMARTIDDWAALAPREVETRTDVLIDLLRKRPWRFALALLPEVSRAQHRFWSDGNGTLQAIYAASDRSIARIIEEVGPETIVFVFSECGAGPVRHGVQLDAWLEREGYLVRRRGPMHRAASKGAVTLLRASRSALRSVHAAVHQWTETHLSRLKKRTRQALGAAGVDWSRTRVFSAPASNQLFFNRELVRDHERRALCDELRGRLLALHDPEGRRVVEDVIARDDPPGLIIVWDDDAYMPAEDLDDRERVFVEWRPESPDWTFTGSHRREGMVMVSGPGIEKRDLGRVPLVDFVPTWLDLLGVRAVAKLDGSSFAHLLEPQRFDRM